MRGMTVQPILIYPKDEALLRTPSEPIDAIDGSVKALIQDLKDTLATQPGAGLAAPQINVHRRVIVVRFGQDRRKMEPSRALINPVILEAGDPMKVFDGCLSLPKIATWDAMRPAWLRFEALDENGDRIEMRVEGADAALVHHEVDHLDGIFFLDRLPDDAQLYLNMKMPDGEQFVPVDKATLLQR
jgi:peptide deformylase